MIRSLSPDGISSASSSSVSANSHKPRQSFLLTAIGLALLFIASAILAYVYIKSERFFYFWDFSAYQSRTQATADVFRTSFIEGLRQVKRSIAEEYNSLYTLPMIPVVLKVGLSRRLFVVCLTLLYHVPFALSVGLVTTRLFSRHKQRAFWAAAITTLLLPTLWIATLRGYPDTGSAALIGLAAFAYLGAQSVPGKASQWVGRALASGVCLALAMLFRRHFTYAVVAFIGAMLLCEAALLVQALLKQRKRTEETTPSAPLSGAFLRAVLRPLFVGVGLLSVLGTLGLGFVRTVLANNYYALYSSYLMPFQQVSQFFWLWFGATVWIASVLGWLTLWRKPNSAQPDAPTHQYQSAGLFVFLWGGLSIALWLGVVRQYGPHYLLHATPFVVPGLVLLWAHLTEVTKRTALVSAIFGVFLFANLVFGLTSSTASWDENPVRKQVFAHRESPLTRPDYQSMLELHRYLRERVDTKSPIYVVGSSVVINEDIIRELDKDHRPPQATALWVVTSPQVDSRDYYPLQHLLPCRYVLVTTPFQHHLAEQEQDVVRIADRMFLENWEIARYYRLLPERFSLMKDATVRIYEQTRPIPLPVVLRTYDQMVRVMKERPGNEPDWLAVTALIKAVRTPGGSLLRAVSPPMGVKFPSVTGKSENLVYIGSARWQGQTLTGQATFPEPLSNIAQGGNGPRLVVSALKEDGTVGPTLAETVLRAGDNPSQAKFTIPLPAQSSQPSHSAGRFMLSIVPGQQSGTGNKVLPAEIMVQPFSTK